MRSTRGISLMLVSVTTTLLITASAHAQVEEIAPVVLEGITATAEACQLGYIGTPPNCWKITSGTVSSTPMGTPTIEGETPPPAPPPPPGTVQDCASVVSLAPEAATNAAKTGLNEMWRNSRPGELWQNRRERGGWLVRTADGSTRVHQWAQHPQADARGISGCADLTEAWVMQQMPPEGAGAIIGMIHTHPYAQGELVKMCDPPYFENYPGTPSNHDHNALAAMSQWPAFGGRPLAGYMIDQNGLKKFGATQNAVQNMGRCGY